MLTKINSPNGIPKSGRGEVASCVLQSSFLLHCAILGQERERERKRREEERQREREEREKERLKQREEKDRHGSSSRPRATDGRCSE
jgi:hypothetical protein